MKIRIFNDDTGLIHHWQRMFTDEKRVYFSETLEFDKDVDFLLVDYGAISEFSDTIKNLVTLKKYYLNGTKLFWCGALSNWMDYTYNDDAFLCFPREKFLHNLEEVSLNDVEEFVKNKLRYIKNGK